MTNPGEKVNQPQNQGQAPRRRGCVFSLPVILATVLVFLILFNVYNFFTGEKPVPDYPNGTKTELTDQGNQFVNNLYQNKERGQSTVKVFLTKDGPQQVLDYYNGELVNKEGFESGTRPAPQLPNAISVAFVKNDRIYVLLTSNSPDNLVKNQQPGDTYIIVAQGRS
jgi:hypothetical protein